MLAGEPKPPQCVSRVVDGAAVEGDADRLPLEVETLQREIERPVIREIVTVIVDPPGDAR
jgi:hypothetical protein